VHGKSALILGATGSVGRNILKEVLDSPRFTRVGEFGRRTTALDTEGLNNKDKLIQKVIDYEKPAEGGFKDEKWDVVFIA
jgi:oxidoreductase